jgi:hypothetical protein
MTVFRDQITFATDILNLFMDVKSIGGSYYIDLKDHVYEIEFRVPFPEVTCTTLTFNEYGPHDIDKLIADIEEIKTLIFRSKTFLDELDQ